MEIEDMEKYRILGVDENASMEEVKRAYENKVREYRDNIKDEKRAMAFIKVFDKAYEEIKLEKEKNQYQQTRVIDRKEVEARQNSDSNEEESTRRRRRDGSSSRSVKSKNHNNKSKNNDKDREEKRSKSRKDQSKKKKESSSTSELIKLPLQIVILPIVALLSLVIFLCKIINLISWIASKVVMIAAIAVSAIHGYQIYIGHAPKYKIFIISGIAFVVALFLPIVLNTLLSILEGINNGLKKLV